MGKHYHSNLGTSSFAYTLVNVTGSGYLLRYPTHQSTHYVQVIIDGEILGDISTTSSSVSILANALEDFHLAPIRFESSLVIKSNRTAYDGGAHYVLD
jgi:hypothetical protein